MSSGIGSNIIAFSMAIIMSFSGMPIGSIINNANQWDKDQIAQERIQLFADYFDAMMQIEFDGPLYLAGEDIFDKESDIPAGTDYVEFDISSIDNFLAFAKRVTEDETLYGGDFTSIDFSALEGKKFEDKPAIELVYDAIQFLEDNDELVAKVLTAEFDYGKLGEACATAFGEKGIMNTFDLYEVLMSMFGVYYDNNSSRIGLNIDVNGTVRLSKMNAYEEKIGECQYPGENTFHSEPIVEWYSEWNEETQSYETVRRETDFVRCYTDLTPEEKSKYSAEIYIVEVFQQYLQTMMKDLGLNEFAAEKFAQSIDAASSGMYAIVPQIVDKIVNLGSEQFGDTIAHIIREFLVRMYGVRHINADFSSEDVRISGVTSENPAFETLRSYYYSQFEYGDYALFDYNLTVDGMDFKMFEASYKTDGTLVFYPYEDTVSGKEVGDVTETIFDMAFAIPSNYKPNTSMRGDTIIDQETGNKYYINNNGKVYLLYDRVFPIAEDVSAGEVSSLTDEHLVVSDELYVYTDGSLGEIDIDSLYAKDGYFYAKTTDADGRATWRRWTTEADTTFYKNINASLGAVCSLVDPYFVYNCKKYDFIDGAREAGGGYVDQLNNIIAAVIKNTCTDEAIAEFNWVAGGNEHLNENLMKVIRSVTGRFFTEGTSKDICNLAALLRDLGEKEAAAIFEEYNKFFYADYYQDTTLENIILDLLLITTCADNTWAVFADKNYKMPDGVDSIEAFAACMIAFTTDELYPHLNTSSNYIHNGILVEKTEEEWKKVVLDEGFELFLRVWAEKAEANAIVFTADEIDNYMLQGWGYMEFLDEIVDRCYIYIEGLVAVCDDLQCKLGVYDGNGPWYKISKILNALLPTALFSDCEKTYGNETLVFDIGVFLEDAIVGNILDVDLSGLLNIITENDNDFNPFYGNNYIKAALICLQNFINAILPGTITDEDIVTPDHLINKNTLAKIAKQLLKTLNERKREIVPVIISWFDVLGAFETIPYVDIESGYGYFIREDEEGKYAEINDFYGEFNGDVIEIPEEIKGLPVRGYSVGYDFENKTVRLPDTVKYFDVRSYYSSYTNYEVDKGNKYLEVVDGVLYDEDMTTILVYPNNKTDETFVVPSTVKNVYSDTFCNNYKLKTLVINEGTQGIYRSVNENSGSGFGFNITDIYIPNSVEYIDYTVFYSWRGSFIIHGPINGYAYKLYNDVLKHDSAYENYSFEYYMPDELFVTFNAEKQAVKSNIYVYGYTLPGAKIKVYDGEQLIGKDNNVKVDKYSKWEGNVPLYNPVDTGSYHDITVVAEKDGETVTSQKITVYYEKNAVVFKEFKMLHSNYYSVTVTDETINKRYSMTWIPGNQTDIRVRVLNSNKLAALYLVSRDGPTEYRVAMERSEKDYWVAPNCYLGNPPGTIRLEGVIKNKGKFETAQIGGDIKINFLIDPSGNIYEFHEQNPLEGVTAKVQYFDEETNLWTDWEAEFYEQSNPIITAADGAFKWVVPKGKWRVVCEKEGYNPYISDTYTIPPEVTGQKYYMMTTEAPVVEECYYDNGVTTIVYDQFITKYLSPEDYQVNGVDGISYIEVSNADEYFNGNSYNFGQTGYKTVKIKCFDSDHNLITEIPSSVTISNVYNYAGKYISTTAEPEDHTKEFNFEVSLDKDNILVGDVVTVTITTEEGKTEAVKVSVDNASVFETEICEYDEYGDVIADTVENVEIPETLTFDENGKASFKVVAGFEGVSTLTFNVGKTVKNVFVKINAKAEDVEHVHDFGTPSVEVKATCCEIGYTYYVCDCGADKFIEYPVVAHSPKEIVSADALRTEASCRARATYYYTCSECNKVLKDGEVLENDNIKNTDYFAYGDRLSHNLGENGECLNDNCSYVNPVEIPECEHKNTTTTTVYATCEKAGIIGRVTCNDCPAVLNEGAVDPAKTHSYTIIVNNNDGSHTRKCQNTNADGWACKEEKTDLCENSKVVVTVVKPACEKSGYTEYKCNVCQYTWTKQDNNALEHSMVVDVVGQAATCTQSGCTDSQRCANCEKTIAAEVIPALKHTFVNEVSAKEATCIAMGNVAYKQCSTCKLYFAANEGELSEKGFESVAKFNIAIDSKKHTNTENKAETPATCLKVGYTAGQYCKGCKTWISGHNEIPALKHDVVVDAAVAATCKNTGLTEGQHCSRCKEVIVAQKKVEKTEHSYNDSGVCTSCGNDKTENCSCKCHKTGFMSFIWKIINFFNKLFKTKKTCACGVVHY